MQFWWGQAEFSPRSSALDLVLALALVVHHEHAKRKTNWTGHSTACHYRTNQLAHEILPCLQNTMIPIPS
jgi:hypothetical protein